MSARMPADGLHGSARRIMRHEAFFLSATRKLMLQGHSWRPLDQRERAAVVLSHHVGDHVGRMHRLGGTLAANGIAMYAYDSQGWGRSENFAMFTRKRMSPGSQPWYTMRSSEQLVADFDKLTTRIMQFYTVKGADPNYKLGKMLREKRNPWDPEPPIAPRIPVFALGHGMGAGVVARYVAERAQRDVDKRKGLAGCCLVAPWIGHTPTLWLGNIGGPASIGLNYYASRNPLSRIGCFEVDPTDLMSELEEVLDWEEDTHTAKTPIPVCTAQTLMELSEQSEKAATEIDVPLKIFIGEKDPLTPVAAAERVLEGAPSTDKDLHVIPEARHDIWRDSEMAAQNSMRALVRWIQEQEAEWETPENPMDDMDEIKRQEIESRYDDIEGDSMNADAN